MAFRVGQILDPKRNNFNLLRLLAAAAVVVSHAVFLRSGQKSDEILAGVTFYNLGDHAVNVFFVLSGLTVAASLARSPSTAEFLIARALRIFPALATCALLLIFVGAMVTICTPTQFLADTRVWRYGLQTLLLGSASTGLPGVFDQNPHASTINASIWTLKFEVACYLTLALIGWLGLLNKHRFAWLLVVSWIAASGFLFTRFGHDMTPIDQAARFWLCFSLGAGLYAFRDQIPLSVIGVVTLGFGLFLTVGTAYVAPSVMLEFGARSTGEPASLRDVACDAAGLIDGVDFPTARPRVMHAERTFWEKATAMHVFCLQERLRGDRFARHWHDVVRLDDAGIAAAALADRDLAHAVAPHKGMFFAEKAVDGAPIDYEAAINGSLQLVPTGEALAALGKDYGQMVDDGLLLEDAEPFDALIERCADIAELANRQAK